MGHPENPLRWVFHRQRDLAQVISVGALSFLAYEIQPFVRAPRIDQIQETDLLNFNRLVYEPECLFAMRTIYIYYVKFSFFPTRAHLYMSRESKLVSGWWFEEALDQNKWKWLISTSISLTRMNYSLFMKTK